MYIVMLVQVVIVRVVQMAIQQVRQRPVAIVNVVRHLERVINVVRIPISTVVMVWGKQARELLVEESIRLVYVQVIMFRFVM